MSNLIINSNIFYIQHEKIDLKEKYIEFKLSESENSFKEYIYSYFFMKPIMIETIKLSSNDNFSFYNCYFCLNDDTVSIKFDTAIIGKHSNDFDIEKTNCVYAKINYKNYNMVDIEEFIKNNSYFNNNQYNYSLSIQFSPRLCIIKIQYSRYIKVSTITKEFLNFFEFICFICGCNFELTELYYTLDNNIEIRKILNLNSKFDINKKNLRTNELLVDYINLNVKDSYINWNILRKSTHLIFDLYLNLIHNFHFTEISLVLLINCMEGYMKSFHFNDKLVLLPNKKLDTILEYTYFSTKYSKLIMRLSERKKYDIFNNLQNHRNYFDHLDRIQPSFKGKIGSYILLKCDLIFRLYIFNDLNVPINENKLKINIKNIEQKYKRS